ncbi:phage tail protein [Gorillibacterium massiliense]|uniref:phage tail protein n=1 Tax=Gorillibacterium massiliense TaxID=1280390 RepID=UPI0004AE3914|nr:phage tail protein [Gorillibacterium massiliense]
MPIASYQKKVFQVSGNKIYTFNGMEWSTTLETETQEKIKDKPSTYVKGYGLSAMSFELPLRVDMNIDVQKEIEEWEAICIKAAADFFIMGTKPLGKNRWLLKSVRTSDTEIDNKGRLLKAKINLDFEEYVRAGKAEAIESNAGSSLSTNPDIVPNSYIDNPNKRDNPNYELSTVSIFKRTHNYAEGV